MSDNTHDIPKCLARKRAGRCYELAAKAIIGLSNTTRWRYMEGYVGDYRFGHAWLTDGAEVFCTTCGDLRNGFRLPAAEYIRQLEPEVLLTMTQMEVAAAVARHRDYGPFSGAQGIKPPVLSKSDAECR